MTSYGDVIEVLLDRGPSTTTEIYESLRARGDPSCRKDTASLVRKMFKWGHLTRRDCNTHIRARYIYEVAPDRITKESDPVNRKSWGEVPVVMVTADGRYIKSYATAKEASVDRDVPLGQILWECDMHDNHGYWPSRWFTWRFAGKVRWAV